MSDETHFFNLPTHVINDILSRLPTKTIIQSRCVCKTWLNLLSESEFTNIHLSRSPPCLIVHNLDANPPDLNCFNLVEFQDEDDHHDFRYMEETKIKPPKTCGKINLSMVGSIHGLVCLNESDRFEFDAIYLWNPTIGESITLPVPEGERSYPNIVSYGFGLSSETGKYKVVRIFQELEKTTLRILKSNCDVYTLGEESGLWRRVGHAHFLYSCYTHGVFLNGNLHWLIHDRDGPELMSCFDLETELFLTFPAPPELNKDLHFASLGVFGGYLCICDGTSDYEIVIWVMKEYGITKQWSKEIVIKTGIAVDLPRDEVVRVIKVFKDGYILLLWGDFYLLWYDSKTEILHQSSVHKLIKNLDDDQVNEEEYTCIKAIEHVSSFLSLKNFGIEMVGSIN